MAELVRSKLPLPAIALDRNRILQRVPSVSHYVRVSSSSSTLTLFFGPKAHWFACTAISREWAARVSRVDSLPRSIPLRFQLLDYST